MILAWLIFIPIATGFLAWWLGRWHALWPRVIALLAFAIDMVLTLLLWNGSPASAFSGGGNWIAQLDLPWITALGIRFHLGMDGLSLWMVLLTAVLGIFSVIASWNEIQERIPFFHLNLLLLTGGVIGVFLALDLFLFYFFWEVMIVPTFFLIVIWGSENRRSAGIKFFLFTQLSGLLMLISILGLYFIHGASSGDYTFDYSKLMGTNWGPVGFWLMMGFVAAFFVKLPAVPVHTWLPDAYTSAPTAGSILLAGLLSKTGAYGLLRFVLPLFPASVNELVYPAMLLGVIGILYGAMLAFAQTDLKRLIAYSSLSHLGFVLLGVFAWNQWSLHGAVMQMICHGLSTGALFMLAGIIEERLKTRDLRQMGGLWTVVPRMGAVMMFFALASLGLPGLGNFIGEFLILLGAFKMHVGLTAAATAGLVAAVVYALWMIQGVFQGPAVEGRKPVDLRIREISALGFFMLALLWLGLYPQPVLDSVGLALDGLMKSKPPIVTRAAAESQGFK